MKRGLSVCTELWRRQIWRDARTVNVIASATAHSSTNVMLAALKFFLGQDLASELDDADKDAEDAEDSAAPPSKAEVYRTYHKVRFLLFYTIVQACGTCKALAYKV